MSGPTAVRLLIGASLLARLALPASLPAQGRAGSSVLAPTDAVVLSTGSSRGLAHAGALLGLERRGYDPDVVVGASMGAVIGSLYAAGYSAEQIWDIALATDWGDIFMASPLLVGPQRDLLFPAVTVALDLRPFEVSSGLIPDWRVNRFLTRLLFDPAARARSDFDRLPRRYRSVAVDLATGGEVVLARGDLARAVRASMGTPGFFAAVRWDDDALLGDGGIVNYLPVSVARALGAARVVAVDVTRAPDEVLRTDPTALASRSISLLMRNALRDTVPPDVLLRPALDPDFPGAVFPDRPDFLLDLGLAAGLEADLTPTEGSPRPRPMGTAPVLATLEVRSGDAVLASLARHALAGAIGATYRPEAVLAAVDRLYATGLFHGIWPRVEAGDAEGDVLIVELDPLPRLTLAGAVGYDNDRGARLWSTLGWRTALLGAPLETAVGAGTDGIGRWGEGSLLLHSGRLPNLAASGGIHHRVGHAPFADGSEDGPRVARTGGWLGARYRRVFPDVIASAALVAERLDLEAGPDGPSWGAVARLSSAVAPGLVVGVPSELSGEARGGVLEYATASARLSRAGRLGALRIAALADGAVALGDAPPDARPALGDRRGMPGLRWGQERGRARLLGGIDAAWPLAGGGWARLRVRGGSAPERAEELRSTRGWVAGAAVEGVWTTPFGPLIAGWGINTRGSHRLDVGIAGAF